MKMKIYQIIIACLFLGSQASFAQNARFTTQGVIEYEKKINMYALIKDQVKKNADRSYYAQAFEDYQKKNPQFKVLKSTLKFSKDQTLFTPIEEDVVGNGFFDFASSDQNNIISTNAAAGTSVAQKKVFEQTYLLKDSTRKINWKITNEMRNIAGYDCRRANALIMDSIYVVAFYTEEIPVSGGPETFSGLPGMILGVALPYEHITWFATSVLDQPVTDDKLKAPIKGKPVDTKQLTNILKAATKDWGEWGQDALKAFLL
ncbi:GLPGLI family protein [Pedobacter frigiditerrae]|uniref:GLPGLI family protein n=1 Tax=Pedobacter frigiditerrae TaxID=2530452 RepID=UPI00292DF474|nr:GLPGLI family protein [Pedobacter frigiditerrae]